MHRVEEVGAKTPQAFCNLVLGEPKRCADAAKAVKRKAAARAKFDGELLMKQHNDDDQDHSEDGFGGFEDADVEVRAGHRRVPPPTRPLLVATTFRCLVRSGRWQWPEGRIRAWLWQQNGNCAHFLTGWWDAVKFNRPHWDYTMDDVFKADVRLGTCASSSSVRAVCCGH